MTMGDNKKDPAAKTLTGCQKKQKNSSWLGRLIKNHYGNTANVKTASQISSEAYLLPGIKFNRWFTMPAAVIVQFCVGSLYAWSVFNKPIDNLIYGEVTNTAPITFTIANGTLGVCAALLGPWLQRRGPKIACILGTLLFFAGNLITALALHLRLMWLVFLGYGVVGGCGIGLCYISPVSVLQKWFPDHRGLAAGIAVCGFGGGAIVMTKVQVICISAFGLPMTFVLLGSSYFVAMIIGSCVLRTPPPDFQIQTQEKPKETDTTEPDVNTTMILDDLKSKSFEKSSQITTVIVDVKEEDELTLIEALASLDYRLMYIMFLAHTMFGLVLISRLSNIVTDIFEKSPYEAATVVSVNGAFNLAGRLIFSTASDYVGRKNCFFVILTIQLVSLCVFSTITTTKTYWAFLLVTWVVTACFGGGFSVIPAFLSDKFGSVNIAGCHGVILTSWSSAGVFGGLIFSAVFNYITNSDGYLDNDPSPYNVNAWWILAVVAVGWTAMVFIKPTKKDEQCLHKIIPCCSK